MVTDKKVTSQTACATACELAEEVVHGLMEIGTKVISSKTSRLVTVFINGLVVINMFESSELI
jgi:hypothetical protein